MRSLHVVAACLAVGVSLGVESSSAVAQDSRATLYESLTGSVAESIVTVKLSLRISGAMGEQEQEVETAGAMLTADGLVLVSNAMVGGDNAFMRSQGLTATPTDVKVLIDDDTEGVAARIIARDSELDLAWIKIAEPAEGGYSSVDFTAAPNPEIGDRIYVVTRTTEFYGRSPLVNEGHIGGAVTKPRQLFAPAGPIGPQIGLPVFNGDGMAIGFLIVVTPDEDELAAANAGADTGIFVLSSSEVAAATTLALEAAAAAQESAVEEAVDEDAGEEPEGEGGGDSQ